MSTRTRFEEEAKGNSEMAYLNTIRSHMTSKCDKNKKVAHEAQPSVLLMFYTKLVCHLCLFKMKRTDLLLS